MATANSEIYQIYQQLIQLENSPQRNRKALDRLYARNEQLRRSTDLSSVDEHRQLKENWELIQKIRTKYEQQERHERQEQHERRMGEESDDSLNMFYVGIGAAALLLAIGLARAFLH